jgi:nitrogen-specific signal transduction histidine kinase/iron only hydrogenase large subunit-like protein
VSIIYSVRERCTGCFACIRNCPVKAIRIHEGLAEVVRDRCIDCGNCINVCVARAKQAESDVEKVWQFLEKPGETVAVLSSSFPAMLLGCSPAQLVGAIKALGFSEVMEDSFGAELVGREYARFLSDTDLKPVISSNCPAVVTYIERYQPSLIPNIAPIVSPMIAMGRLIKKFLSPQSRVVFIGPCVAKKLESINEAADRSVDAVITFTELKAMMAEKGIAPGQQAGRKFDGPFSHSGRLFPISGGLLRIIGLSDDISRNDVLSIHGRDYAVKIMGEFAHGEIKAKFANVYFCHGCIDGPFIDNELSGSRRKDLVARYARNNAIPEKSEEFLKQYSDINLSRSFGAQPVTYTQLYEEEIQKITSKLGGTDCGACGYNSCRELAISICQDMAEVEMCWPYVLHELKNTQEGLIRAEKLTSLGQLAASIAHEVNNPLSGVLVYTQLLEKKLASGRMSEETTGEYLSKMERELVRSTRLIRNLLDFARQSPPSLRMVNCNDVITKSLELAAHSAVLQHIEVVKELDEKTPNIMADFDQLQQVCTNLILNAIQAMPGGGTLTLRTSGNNGSVKMEVQDTGLGITPENMRHLFTPFFTTKDKGKGVGLGLAIAHGIIERHNGKIEVQSQAGKGTTFSVTLPLEHDEK